MPRKEIAFIFGDAGDYIPYNTRRYSDEDVRREYQRLRKIAKERISRLEMSEFSKSQSVLEHKERYPTMRELKGDMRELRFQLYDLRRFLDSGYSTVSGQKAIKKQRIETLQARGWNVNSANYNAFVSFMEYAKAYFGGSFSSDTVRLYLDGREIGKTGVDQMKKGFAKFLKEQAPELAFENMSKVEKAAYKSRMKEYKKTYGNKKL